MYSEENRALKYAIAASIVLHGALLFGVSHGYQGWVQIVKISLLGLLFGLAALLRRSLVPGMAAHAAADVIGGLAIFR